MSKKLEIKPIHLVLTGIGIIVLGILIPSLFVSAYSTMGFALIIGLIVLVSAYIFFSINIVKSRGAQTVKWLLIPVAVAALGAGGWYAYHTHQQNLKDKIYNVGEVVELPDFTVQVKEPSFKPVDMKVPEDKAQRFGGIDASEDCSKYPDDSRPENSYMDFAFDENEWEKENPSGRYCEWRNNSRKTVSEYIANNERMILNYEITASDTVDSSQVDISVMPDSGRNMKSPAKQFDYDPLLSKKYAPAFDYTYRPYSATDIGGDINTGITRQGKIEADVRNSESAIDFKISYKGESRIIRVSR